MTIVANCPCTTCPKTCECDKCEPTDDRCCCGEKCTCGPACRCEPACGCDKA